MLQWTAAGKGSRFMLLIHHTDAEREWAYDRHSFAGLLDKASTKAEKWADGGGYEKRLEADISLSMMEIDLK